MPKHKSSKKRIVTSKKQNKRNRIAKSKLQTAISKVVDSKDKAAAEAALKAAYSVIDKTAISKVIHKNKAANQKARLAKLVNKIAK
jgi:small subunit ribosomal protein S20